MGKLLDRVERIAKAKGGRVTAVGLGGPMDLPLVEETVRRVFGKVRLIRVGESEIAFALHGVDWGVSLVAGTGASCRAHPPEGLAIGCGGFGPQFGDEGSGFWIGRAAISAAMRAGDKRGPETALTARLCAFYGLSRVLDILRFVDKSGHVSGTKVAACVPEVFAAANAGDTVANDICREAGLALGRLVVATARNVKWSRTPIPLVLTGGVFNGGTLILKPLRRVLRGSRVAFHMYPVIPEPTEGIIKIIRTTTGGAGLCPRSS
jgi:N-acetylglucosamine kinase-like BadF-type ATPase